MTDDPPLGPQVRPYEDTFSAADAIKDELARRAEADLAAAREELAKVRAEKEMLRGAAVKLLRVWPINEVDELEKAVRAGGSVSEVGEDNLVGEVVVAARKLVSAKKIPTSSFSEYMKKAGAFDQAYNEIAEALARLDGGGG